MIRIHTLIFTILTGVFLLGFAPSAFAVSGSPAASTSGASSGSSGGCGSLSGAKKQVLQGVGQTGSNCSDSGVSKTIKTIISIFSYIVGVVCVVMIMVGGFKYITSGGSSEGVSSAKSTIMYALIGLIIVALAQLIVQFVLGQVKV